MKPILFNTEMVKAILAGRKTVTRRVVKLKYDNTHVQWLENKYGKHLVEMQNDVEGETFGKNTDGTTWHKVLACREIKPHCQPGDILYIRETWCELPKGNYHYKADQGMRIDEVFHQIYGIKWRPSIHMPKQAARLFLKVTDVRAERLQNIDGKGISREGVEFGFCNLGHDYRCDDCGGRLPCISRNNFFALWDSTVPKKDLDRFGWAANPWVWVIEFERCEKPEVQREV